MNPLIGMLLPKIIDKFIPDAEEKAKFEQQLAQMDAAQRTETLQFLAQMNAGQVAINTEEAKSTSLYKSGWRPFFGWGMACSILYSTFFYHVLSWLVPALFGPAYAPPVLPVNDFMWEAMFGMLGISWLRSQDKKEGVG